MTSVTIRKRGKSIGYGSSIGIEQKSMALDDLE